MWAWRKVDYMVLGVWCGEAVFPPVQYYWLCSGSRVLRRQQVHDLGQKRKKTVQKATRKMVRERERERFSWPYYWAWTRGAVWGRDWWSRSGWGPECSRWQWQFQTQWRLAGQWGAKRESGYCSFILGTELASKKRHLYVILYCLSIFIFRRVFDICLPDDMGWTSPVPVV